jgi:hypothetical protein
MDELRRALRLASRLQHRNGSRREERSCHVVGEKRGERREERGEMLP